MAHEQAGISCPSAMLSKKGGDPASGGVAFVIPGPRGQGGDRRGGHLPQVRGCYRLDPTDCTRAAE